MPAPHWIAGRYEVLETLCSDARGDELRARDRTLGREVLLVRRSGSSPMLGSVAAERALREARALAGLRHPAIQKLHDVVEDENGPTLVLEPVAGETLADKLAREERLAPEEVRRLGIELADALAAVHAAGAVHRDVGERNVILRADGSPCLTGFRLAKPAALSGTTSIQYSQDPCASSAEHGCLPAHPAPEQLGGEVASARTDVFALGCVLYRALTGRAAMPDHLTSGWSAPRDPARLAPGTSATLAKLVLACLARSPIGRPQSAIELRDGLRAAGGGKQARRPKGGLLAGVSVAAVIALALVAWRFRPHDESASSERGLATANERPAVSSGAYSPGFGKALALLIGIGEEYGKQGFPPLANAVGDVVSVAKALEALPGDRWKTKPLLEERATRDGILDALAELEAELTSEDRALIYFAGHGMKHESSGSSGWILPADAETPDRDPAHKKWLYFDQFARFLDETEAKHVMIAMDCCYSGRLATSTRSAVTNAYEERFLRNRALVVLASGRADERVDDSGPTREHSPFAEVFLDALTPGGGGITSSMLLSRMLRHFTEESVRQTPVLHPLDAHQGEFVFLLGL